MGLHRVMGLHGVLDIAGVMGLHGVMGLPGVVDQRVENALPVSRSDPLLPHQLVHHFLSDCGQTLLLTVQHHHTCARQERLLITILADDFNVVEEM